MGDRMVEKVAAVARRAYRAELTMRFMLPPKQAGAYPPIWRACWPIRGPSVLATLWWRKRPMPSPSPDNRLPATRRSKYAVRYRLSETGQPLTARFDTDIEAVRFMERMVRQGATILECTPPSAAGVAA